MLRTKGFREVVKGAKGIKIVADLPGGAARDSAYKTAQDILEPNPAWPAFSASTIRRHTARWPQSRKPVVRARSRSSARWPAGGKAGDQGRERSPSEPSPVSR